MPKQFEVLLYLLCRASDGPEIWTLAVTPIVLMQQNSNNMALAGIRMQIAYIVKARLRAVSPRIIFLATPGKARGYYVYYHY